MAEDVLVGRATILIASPHRITSYHIDSDVNYLLQIAGDKSFSVFDQTDRALITDEELERYFSGDESAACFKPDRQTEATASRSPGGIWRARPVHGAALGAQRRAGVDSGQL